MTFIMIKIVAELLFAGVSPVAMNDIGSAIQLHGVIEVYPQESTVIPQSTVAMPLEDTISVASISTLEADDAIEGPLYPPWNQGYAAHYGVGVMDMVADNRGQPRYPCMISYTEADGTMIGMHMNVVSMIDGDIMTCYIMDMPRPEHYARIKGKNIIIELDFESAKKLCNISSVGQEPPRTCPVQITNPEW